MWPSRPVIVWRRWRARGGLQDLAALVVAIGVALALFVMLVF